MIQRAMICDGEMLSFIKLKYQKWIKGYLPFEEFTMNLLKSEETGWLDKIEFSIVERKYSKAEEMRSKFPESVRPLS